MGGTGSQEFMIESKFGEDTVARCRSCGYASNLEVATSGVAPVGKTGNNGPTEEIHTPNVRTIDELVTFLKVDHSRLAKSVVYRHDGKPVLLLMMGNDQLNESKLTAILGGGDISAMPAEDLRVLTGADGGSIGPVGLKGFRIIADKRLEGANGLVSGANRNDYHLANIDLSRDAVIERYADLRTVEDGEPCPKCGKPLVVSNAIELGHIFKLGTKYSEALNIRFLDENGQSQLVIMGSYGIGIERIVACALEQSHDENGIIWPKSIAPYQVHLIGVNMSNPAVAEQANLLYDGLTKAGVEVLFDDRANISPGFKFKDADLLGMPIHVIVGEKGLKNQQVEIKRRATGERTMIPLAGAAEAIRNITTN